MYPFPMSLGSIGSQAFVNYAIVGNPLGISSAMEEFGRIFLYSTKIDKMFGFWINIFQLLRNCDILPACGTFFEVSSGENKPFING